MKNGSLKEKLDRASLLLNVLVRIKNKNMIPCDRYYYVLKIYQQARKDYEASKISNPLIAQSVNKKCYFDYPELKVTSSTHERWKKRINKDVDDKFFNRRL
jgi:thymidylate kinase